MAEKKYVFLKNCCPTMTIYSAKDSDFCILLAVHGLTTLKLKGSFEKRDNGRPVVLGMHIDVKGYWTKHPKYGSSFVCEFWCESIPDKKKEMEDYLAGKFVKGVGPYVARNIVETFGKDSFRILDEEPDRLAEVKGIGKKRLQWIKDTWNREVARRRVMMLLGSLSLPEGAAEKIYRKFRRHTEEVLLHDPYQISGQVEGFSFHKADAIAMQLGMALDCPARIDAGIRQAVRDNSNEDKNTCLGRDAAISRAIKVLGEGAADRDKVEKRLDLLIHRNELITEEGMVFDPTDYFMEKYSARDLWRLASCKVKKLKARFGGDDIEYSPDQKEAVETAMTCSVMVLTGGPGTGKTTSTKKIIESFKHWGLRVMLAAPTGKAARRARESTGHYAQTIHMMLGYNGSSWEHGPDNPLSYDAVIVDEFSMVDLQLFYRLLESLRKGTRLIMIGDKDQLPSVGAGCVLRDVISSGVIKTVSLGKIFRQAEGSSIITNAHRIMEGKSDFVTDDAFYMARFPNRLTKDDPEKEAASYIADCVARSMPKALHIAPWEIQVLSPTKKNTLGTDNLNKLIRERLNPDGEMVEVPGGTYRCGDRVMQTRNDYSKRVFNGEVGYIRDLSPKGCTIDFEGKVLEYTREEMEDIMLAYAATVHKAQGSEYRAVIMPLCRSHRNMLCKNIFYTGLTRAQQIFLLVDVDQRSAVAVKKEETSKRITMLSRWLADLGAKRKEVE